MKTLEEHITSGRTFESAGKTYRTPAPQLVCADGTTLSVQASSNHYCTPRTDTGPWTHVEVGFPSAPPGDLWKEYAEQWDIPTDTVYAYVPTELVLFYIGAHGGIADA